MGRRTHRTTVAVLAASLGLVGLATQDTVASAPANADVAASAHAAVGMPQPTDIRSAVGQLSRSGKARSSATASAVCDGCEARARTVQVVYAKGPTVAADNVAAAWSSSCVDCGASSVAVQVVLVGPRAGGAALTNRALAVNAACEGCATEALAVQLVLAGGNRRELTEQAHEALAGLAAQLQVDLETPWPGRRSMRASGARPEALGRGDSPEEQTVAAMADALRRLSGGEVTVNLDVRHAS